MVHFFAQNDKGVREKEKKKKINFLRTQANLNSLNKHKRKSGYMIFKWFMGYLVPLISS